MSWQESVIMIIVYGVLVYLFMVFLEGLTYLYSWLLNIYYRRSKRGRRTNNQ
jgi:hypothetical protein